MFMLRKKYKAIKLAEIITAVLLEIGVFVLLLFRFDILVVIIPSALAVIIALIFGLKLNSQFHKSKIDSCLYEDCDPEKYLYELQNNNYFTCSYLGLFILCLLYAFMKPLNI